MMKHKAHRDNFWLHFDIKNTDRSVGALLSNEISKTHGRDGLPVSQREVKPKSPPHNRKMR
jgi:glutamate synthase domain-containing protein 3